MAYVSHSPYRAYVASRKVAGVNAKVVVIAALIVGVAFMSLSWAAIDGTSADQALAKGDRLTTVAVAAATEPSSGGGYVGAGSTTFVQKGATTGFSVDSPYLAATR